MPMLFPRFWVPIFEDGSEREREFSLFALREMLEALVKVNVGWISSHRDKFRPIYSSGARYAAERGTEDWLSIPEIYKAIKSGKPIDCEDFAAARAAELRLGIGSGMGKVHAVADINGRAMPGGRIQMHAFVRFPDGSVEDPAKKLGMPGPGAKEHNNAAAAVRLHRRKAA
jgi:hypothetical protein